MKTKNQNSNEGLGNPEQLNNNTAVAEAQTAPVEKKDITIREANSPLGASNSWQSREDHRLPIDSEARKANRTLPTPKVLNLLHTQLPAAYRLAEVVGKWVWVRFTEQPAAEVRQQLAQFGFHWNRERQAWQHPCGKFSLGSQADPHEKYSSYRPASIKTPRRAEASAKAGAQPIAAAA